MTVFGEQLFCEEADLYSYGIPRGSLSNPGRVLAGVDVSANTFLLGAHGFSSGSPCSFRSEPGGSLPSPIVSNTTYYAVPVTDSSFSVSATSGGGVIDITSTGTRIVVVAPLDIAGAISWASTMIAESIPHLLPLTAPYPAVVVMSAAELAGAKLATLSGASTVSLSSVVDQALARIRDWKRGIPVRSAKATASNNVSASASAASRDTRGWRRFGAL